MTVFDNRVAKVANMSVYEVLTIVLIAVIGLAATAAIYLALAYAAKLMFGISLAFNTMR